MSMSLLWSVIIGQVYLGNFLLNVAMLIVALQPGPSCLSLWKTHFKSKTKLVMVHKSSPLKAIRRASVTTGSR
jgi:hypothetical protein